MLQREQAEDDVLIFNFDYQQFGILGKRKLAISLRIIALYVVIEIIILNFPSP